MAAALAYITLHQSDRAGLVVFADEIRAMVGRSGQRSNWRKIVESLSTQPVDAPTDFGRVIDQTLAKVTNRCLFAIISDQDVWVEANLKETQLTHVKLGQTVQVEIDAYPGVSWPATIGSISPATGAEFAVLPPQNASGNWVKVVQRLPVRIEILEFADRPTLRAGMTATITVDTEQDKSFETVWGQYMEKLDGWKQSLLASAALAN